MKKIEDMHSVYQSFYSGFTGWNMCDRKKVYLNKKTANKRAREFNQYVYNCPKCGGYHLTKREQDERKT